MRAYLLVDLVGDGPFFVGGIGVRSSADNAGEWVLLM